MPACAALGWTSRPGGWSRAVDREPAADRDRQGADAERKLLILDEPPPRSAARKPASVPPDRAAEGRGVGIIYISHRLEEIRQIADRIVVMRDGAKVQEFDRGDVPVRTIVEAMVGRSLERMFPAIPTRRIRSRLRCAGFARRAAPSGTLISP